MLGVGGSMGSVFRLEGCSEAVNVRVKIAPMDCVCLDEVVKELNTNGENKLTR